MDVKESARAAKRYVADIFSDEEIRDVRLEEIELDDAGIWHITVSFLRPAEAPDQPERPVTQQLVLGIGLPRLPALQRSYKIVDIDDGSGRVRAVKHRVLAAAD